MNQTAIRMKTKVICISVLTFLFVLNTGWHFCTSANTSLEAGGHHFSLSSDDALVEDWCPKHGHAHACSFEQHDLAMDGGGYNEGHVDLSKSLHCPKLYSIALDSPIHFRCINRRPTQLTLQTPISLFEKLSS